MWSHSLSEIQGSNLGLGTTLSTCTRRRRARLGRAQCPGGTHPVLTNDDALAQGCQPCPTQKEGPAGNWEPSKRDSDGEKSNSLQGDGVHSRHGSLNLQVPPAAEDKATLIKSAGPHPEEAPPTESNPGGPGIGRYVPQTTHVSASLCEVTWLSGHLAPGVHKSGFKDISHGAHLLVSNVFFLSFYRNSSHVLHHGGSLPPWNACLTRDSPANRLGFHPWSELTLTPAPSPMLATVPSGCPLPSRQPDPLQPSESGCRIHELLGLRVLSTSGAAPLSPRGAAGLPYRHACTS